MARSARALLDENQMKHAPRDGDNLRVPLITAGRAPRAVFAALAAEEKRITSSDWRSFHALAARADEPYARAFFGGLAPGEQQANGMLDALIDATGPDHGEERPRASHATYAGYA